MLVVALDDSGFDADSFKLYVSYQLSSDLPAKTRRQSLLCPGGNILCLNGRNRSITARVLVILNGVYRITISRTSRS